MVNLLYAYEGIYSPSPLKGSREFITVKGTARRLLGKPWTYAAVSRQKYSFYRWEPGIKKHL
ncbi:MAG: hypothetical protein HQL69_18915 [Magnetococcales bacterium]|nr:hypothetical protein [Magnetococcales bacterium]